jgi:N-acylneuraminate cytidylyltransferase/CMP-N,N'-diacetyllegionaminic acid synthase
LKTLYLITARGGSKGVPGKNLRQIQGVSLVGFKALAARKSKHCTRLIISTDSPDIQDDARRYGVEVPFTRPAELATDTATSVDVIVHAMEWIEREGRERYEAVMLLEPSAPFARAADFDGAMEMMVANDANVVVGVRPMEVNSVFVGPLGEKGRLSAIVDKMQERQKARRQDLPQEYTMNGCLYLFRWDFFKKNRSLYCDRDHTYGYVMDPHYSIEIDSLFDLHMAEHMAQQGYVDMAHWKA